MAGTVTRRIAGVYRWKSGGKHSVCCFCFLIYKHSENKCSCCCTAATAVAAAAAAGSGGVAQCAADGAIAHDVVMGVQFVF